MNDWSSIRAKRGDRILPKWNKLINKAEEAYVTAGKHTKVRRLPNGKILVTGEPPVRIAPHPWRVSSLDEEQRVRITEGTVAGRFPWITDEARLGQETEDGEIIGLKLKPKSEGYSYVAVGVNVSASESGLAEIDANGADTWEQLRLQEIDELPKGFGTGGVLPDGAGWAWYPLVRLEWSQKSVQRKFQIVRHNLGHLVLKGDNNEARHFFPPL